MIISKSDVLSQIYKKKLISTFFFTNARNVRMIAKTSVFFIKKEKKIIFGVGEFRYREFLIILMSPVPR